MWSDSSRLTALCCLSVASMYGGCVPDDSVLIKRVCHLNWRVDLQPLIDSGFLIENASIVLADASKVLARERVETETETEKKKVRLEVASPKLPKTRGSRLPSIWTPTTEGHLLAVERLGESGATQEVEKFRDYWAAAPGQKGTKLDWDATWRNWVRNAKAPYSGNGYGNSMKERTANALQRLGSEPLRQTLDFGLPKLIDN